MITNSGSQRFDVYSGPFTKNDQLTASPFADSFQYIPNVPFSAANQVLPALNNAGANERRSLDEELYGRGHVEQIYRKWLEEMDARNDGLERRAAQNLTLGYVTQDVSVSSHSGVLAYQSLDLTRIVSFDFLPSFINRPALALVTTPSMPHWHSTTSQTSSAPCHQLI